MPQLEDILGTSCHRQKSLLDIAIETYENADSDISPEQEQGLLNYISCLASVHARIQKYRNQAADWKTVDFRNDRFCSQKLGAHMALAGKQNPCPSIAGQKPIAPNRIEAHHIVPGDDKRYEKAILLRARLARAKIRPDDPDNGVWLPKTSRDRLPNCPNAVPHRRIHREGYYRYISGPLVNERNPVMFRIKLSVIARQLQTGDVPPWMMSPKHQLPDE